jgi:hypothetical protein
MMTSKQEITKVKRSTSRKEQQEGKETDASAILPLRKHQRDSILIVSQIL